MIKYKIKKALSFHTNNFLDALVPSLFCPTTGSKIQPREVVQYPYGEPVWKNDQTRSNWYTVQRGK